MSIERARTFDIDIILPSQIDNVIALVALDRLDHLAVCLFKTDFDPKGEKR